MDNPTLTCHDEDRRQAVRNKGLNGIDFIVVCCSDEKYPSLCVHLFGKGLENIKKASVRIEGGRRIRDLQVIDVCVEENKDPEREDCLRVNLNKYGDLSTYTLRLVELKDGRAQDEPLDGFDPRYAQAQFSFAVCCSSSNDLDCRKERVCPQQERIEPEIDYLAKDYSSFRQLILDRMALIMPDWRERHIPDLGIALVEVLAYVGDYLSYYQDAVATEAYLDTARQRISVRRHVRLVDYLIHEGCNARTWVCVSTDQDIPQLDPKDVFFITAPPDLRASGHVLKADDLLDIPPDQYEVFEPIVERDSFIYLYRANSEIHFYTWGDKECCLPRGATRATLMDVLENDQEQTSLQSEQSETPKKTKPRPAGKLRLRAGDVLIFEEVKGPQTGNPADADPAHRQAVRLIKVEPGIDKLFDKPVVEIEWMAEDALQFPLCISSILPAPDCKLLEDISVARGNVILVDHGKTIDPPESLGIVASAFVESKCICGRAGDAICRPGEFRSILKKSPLVFSQPIVPMTSASSMLLQKPHLALPQITLTGLPGAKGEPIVPGDPKWKWYPKYDLLDSGDLDQVFVVEMDNDGRAHLRFGDDELGKVPEANTAFMAVYRVGNGPQGNIGADTISYLVLHSTLSGATLTPRNPLPAQGGTAQEPMADIKLYAPRTFRKDLQRAITRDDYANFAKGHGKIQNAAADIQWTGSWYEADVAIDPLGKEELDDGLRQEMEGYLHSFRRMGQDVRVVQAVYVPLDLVLTVCVLPHYLKGHVEAALLDRFSNVRLPDGKLGFFHPDNLTFGEGIAVSKIIAIAQAVPGVESVSAICLKRLGDGDSLHISDGILKLGRMEIAQMDNDPNFPENGRLTLNMGGGR